MSDIKERVREWLEVPHYRFVGNEKRLAKCNYCGVMAETWSDVIHNYKCPHALLAAASQRIETQAAEIEALRAEWCKDLVDQGFTAREAELYIEVCLKAGGYSALEGQEQEVDEDGA